MQQLKNIGFRFWWACLSIWDPRIYIQKKYFKTEEEMNFFLEKKNVCKYEWNLLQDAGRPLAEATRLLQEQYPEYKEENRHVFMGPFGKKCLGGLFEG